MEKKSICFPSLKCLRKKSSSAKLHSSIRMPTIREFLSNPTNTNTQTLSTKRNLSETSTMLKSASTHKSSLVIKRLKPSPSVSINESVKSINVSQISKTSFLPVNRNTFFLSKGSFEEIFECENKISQPACTSRVMIATQNPFVMENKKLKVVAVTPSKKRGSSYGSRPSLKSRLNPFEYVREVTKNRRVCSGQWGRELEEINFLK